MTRVWLVYFRQNGRCIGRGEYESALDDLIPIWHEVDDMRRLGRLPSLPLNAGHSLIVLVHAPSVRGTEPYLVLPPLVDEEDVTPIRGVPIPSKDTS